MPSGLLIIDKPSGVTSRDVVNGVQRRMRRVKCGHAGTLDPLARGVLVVCVGPATRLIRFVQDQGKVYEGEFLLGVRSDTDDIEGRVTAVDGATRPSESEIRAALPQFVGEILQRPPAYSALKVAGRRAYALAREGVEVDLAPRPVRIDSLEFLEYLPEESPPRLRLRIACGSGTYIRALGRDLGEALGCGAVMSGLVRTAIGPFTLANAVDGAGLETEDLPARLEPPLRAVEHLPRRTADDSELLRLAAGQTIVAPGTQAGEEWAVVDDQGRLRLVGLVPHDGELRASINLPAPE